MGLDIDGFVLVLVCLLLLDAVCQKFTFALPLIEPPALKRLSHWNTFQDRIVEARISIDLLDLETRHLHQIVPLLLRALLRR